MAGLLPEKDAVRCREMWDQRALRSISFSISSTKLTRSTSYRSTFRCAQSRFSNDVGAFMIAHDLRSDTLTSLSRTRRFQSLSPYPRKRNERAEKCLRKAAGTAFIFRDRKSTRLNSSHSSISYAVFCLKKKKKKKIKTQNKHNAITLH